MTVWRDCLIDDVFDVARGGSPRPIDKYITSDPDGINWIMIGDTSEKSKYITKTKKKILKSGQKKSRMVYPGDFLLTNSMSFGRPYINQIQGCIHDGWLVLSPRDKEAVHPDFFYYLLGSTELKRIFTKQAAGAVVKNLNIDIVKGTPVRIPVEVGEQRRIAAILDKADAIRRKRERITGLADELVRSAYIRTVGTMNPDYSHWTPMRIEELAEDKKGSMRTGPFGSALLHSEFVDKGIAVLGIDNAVQNRFTWSERRFITEHKYSELKRYRVFPNDVIITIMGTTGRSAVVPDDVPEAITTKHLATITCDRRKVLPELLSFAIHSDPLIIRQIEKANKGAVMDGLNLSIIRQLEINVPPIPVQEQFVRILRTSIQLKDQSSSKLGSGCDLFSSLSQRAFRGEL